MQSLTDYFNNEVAWYGQKWTERDAHSDMISMSVLVNLEDWVWIEMEGGLDTNALATDRSPLRSASKGCRASDS